MDHAPSWNSASSRSPTSHRLGDDAGRDEAALGREPGPRDEAEEGIERPPGALEAARDGAVDRRGVPAADEREQPGERRQRREDRVAPGPGPDERQARRRGMGLRDPRRRGELRDGGRRLLGDGGGRLGHGRTIRDDPRRRRDGGAAGRSSRAATRGARPAPGPVLGAADPQVVDAGLDKAVGSRRRWPRPRSGSSGLPSRRASATRTTTSRRRRCRRQAPRTRRSASRPRPRRSRAASRRSRRCCRGRGSSGT